jgi:hypothetical protein
VPLYSKATMPDGMMAFFSFVGVAGFEPTTSSSRTKRATGLRYTPIGSLVDPGGKNTKTL